MIGFCFWDKLRHINPVPVAIVETGSGPGGYVYACLPCITRYGIVPLAEHPEGADSTVIHYRQKVTA